MNSVLAECVASDVVVSVLAFHTFLVGFLLCKSSKVQRRSLDLTLDFILLYVAERL